jgi:acyl-CoA synthetase (AMP-forming)/AMP-acid ligase II/thioesterase domain-containing protein/acyl carrier protein
MIYRMMPSGDEIAVQSLRLHARETPHSPAVLAPGRTSLTFAAMTAHVEYLSQALVDAGLGPNDALAAVLPDDAETLCAFIGTCPVTSFAPLNPSLRDGEYESALVDLRPSALMVPAGEPSPAAGAAKRLGIPIIETHSTPERGAGTFTLAGSRTATSAVPAVPAAGDAALQLQTSATTGRAKFVCLTHANIAAMAHAGAQAIMLSRADRFLNMMPMFHLQGLLSALQQLTVGGSVVCAWPFEADRFGAWIAEFQPTWYTGGPALHRTILTLCLENPEILARWRPRFVRSIGSALPPALLSELEGTLRVPVVEGYGLTETGAVTSTPLQPYAAKAGSAGVRIAPGVEIMDEAGNLLPAGRQGEIVVRGPNVMREYRNNGQATCAAFQGGWFRTGDLGRFDDEGYLFVTGRIKEIINRGGEKILPGEVDRALLAHPAVADAAAFAIPHPGLGEDLAAAVVPRGGMSLDEAALREFLDARLAAYKSPRFLMFVERIPRSASGKVQRWRLAEELAGMQKARASAPTAPRSDDERKLAGIWAAALGKPVPGIDDDFFELGGHSLASTIVLAGIEHTFGVKLRDYALMEAPTIRLLAARLRADGLKGRVVAMQPEGSMPAFFMVRPLPLYRPLAARLGNARPFLALAMPGREQLAGESDVPNVARRLASAVRQWQPKGPYFLGGWCADGVLAFEMAQQLMSQGEKVALVALFDSPSPASLRKRPFGFKVSRYLGAVEWSLRYHVASIRQLAAGEALAYIWERLAAFARSVAGAIRSVAMRRPRSTDTARGEGNPTGIHPRIRTYEPQPYSGRLCLFRASGRRMGWIGDPSYGWEAVARGGLAVHEAPGDHVTMFLPPHVDTLARVLAADLELVSSEVEPPSHPTADMAAEPRL